MISNHLCCSDRRRAWDRLECALNILRQEKAVAAEQAERQRAAERCGPAFHFHPFEIRSRESCRLLRAEEMFLCPQDARTPFRTAAGATFASAYENDRWLAHPICIDPPDKTALRIQRQQTKRRRNHSSKKTRRRRPFRKTTRPARSKSGSSPTLPTPHPQPMPRWRRRVGVGGRRRC